MKQFLLFFIFGFIHLSVLQGQNTPSVPVGMNFQAVARDMDGQVKADMPVFLRISLTSADESPTVFYKEEHSVYTDDLGLFNIIIGQGRSILGNTLLEVPWSKEDVWMQIEMATKGSTQYQLVSNTQMLAVPIAMRAERADHMVDEELLLRNQSIYWNTSGNKESRPDQHFVGTRDNRDFVIKTSNTERARFTKEGQLQITAGVMDGRRDDESLGSYPVTVEGSNQGIFIKVDENRSSSNNFVTFADNLQVWGTIEGQTYIELITSRNYIIEAALFSIKVVSTAIQIGSSFGEGSALVATLLASGAGVAEFADNVGKITKATSLGIQLAAWIAKNAVCVGVNYASGGADYAEYLLRDSLSRDLFPAEVVGVNGGIVSLNTADADHIMVVSTNPIVLGNMPTDDQESLHEKIAFMGQVPVRISGPVSIGDYILPSGNNDGMGIAVHPEDMQWGDYPRIVGVAWEAAQDNIVNLVNVAVGINSEDMAQRADLLNRQVDNIMDFLEGKAPLVTDTEQLKAERKAEQAVTSVQKILSDEEFMGIIEEHSDELVKVFTKAKKVLNNQNFDFSLYPGLEELFDNPIEIIQKVRKAPEYATQWHFADKQLKKVLEKQD
ncbi:MAG TPA: hypothetical protein VJ953_18635 [Saprospiraceae bacterium]|nr:hypothetical protein [Saprospiraceae bacterium]